MQRITPANTLNRKKLFRLKSKASHILRICCLVRMSSTVNVYLIHSPGLTPNFACVQQVALNNQNKAPPFFNNFTVFFAGKVLKSIEKAHSRKSVRNLFPEELCGNPVKKDSCTDSHYDPGDHSRNDQDRQIVDQLRS